MQPTTIIAIIVRLFAVALFLFSVERAALLFVAEPSDMYSYLYYFAVFSGLFGSILLWVFPALVAKKLVPVSPTNISHSQQSLNNWYQLAFVSIGMYLLLNAISDLFYWSTYLLYIKEQAINYVFTEDTAENKAAMIVSVFELVLAVIFIFGSKRIITLIRTNKVKE